MPEFQLDKRGEENRVIFLAPFFQYRVWGSKVDGWAKKWIRSDFVPSKIGAVGEIWVVSARSENHSIVRNGKYRNQSLNYLWKNKPELFNYYPSSIYPFLTKILLPSDNLSVQIHPNDAYAQNHLNELGKEECWYVLECGMLNGVKERRKVDKCEVIYGHNAQDRKDFIKAVDEQRWSYLLRKIPIKKDQFIYISAGTVHGLLAGTVVFELQQNSDITFRMYDYERGNGNSRELHLAEVKKCAIVPHVDSDLNKYCGNHDMYLVKNNFFNLQKIVCKENDNNLLKKYSYPKANWIQATVVKGKGMIDKILIEAGDSFILPYGYNEFVCKGKFVMMVVWV